MTILLQITSIVDNLVKIASDVINNGKSKNGNHKIKKETD
jgi:hypothetical protein